MKTPKTLFLAWQDPISRSWFAIGRLTFDEGIYQFVYTQGVKEAEEKCAFKPLSSFPCLDEVYTSTIIRKIEKVLSSARIFTLPGKKSLYQSDSLINTVVIDVTESPIERPKKQKQFYSSQKKKHTLKSQVIVNQVTGEIICTAHGKGKMHDFRLFKQSKIPLSQTIECLADKGYQGIQKIHANSQVPKKKPRKGKLSSSDKKRNRELARNRVIGEHINRRLKIFKILADRYRNRRKRFGLRFNLIAGLYNYELRLNDQINKQKL